MTIVGSIKRIIRVIAGGMLITVLFNTNYVKAYSSCIVQTRTNDNQIYFYVNNIPEIRSAKIQIGTELCNDVKVQKISDMKNIKIDTLIMVDNSLSISQQNRGKQKEVLENIIKNHHDNERFSIVTFSKTLSGEMNFSEDYAGLISTIQNIEYVNQDTYIIDALYEAVEKLMDGDDKNYKRIIIASDGVDDNKTGYTKDELIRLLEKKKCPIYSLASLWNKYEEGVENMFEISRFTNSKYFLLDEYENVEEISRQLIDDYLAYSLSCLLPEDVMDGLKKNVKAIVKTINGEVILEAETVMPFLRLDEKQEKIPSPMPTKKQENIEEKKIVKENLNIQYAIMITGGGIIILFTVILVIIRKSKKEEKKKEAFEYIQEKYYEDIIEDSDDIDKTVLLPIEKGDEYDKTVIMWNDKSSIVLEFVNLNNFNETITKTLTDELILGRKQGCNLVFPHEKTVSGRHCKLTLINGQVYVEDLGSSNKTWINDCEVLQREELHSGDQLKMGSLELKIVFR